MLALYATRYWKMIGAGLIVALLLAWGMRVDHLRGRYKDALAVLAGQAQGVVGVLRVASGNPDVEWPTAKGQIVALGESRKALKLAVDIQTQAVDEWAREAADRKAEAAEIVIIAGDLLSGKSSIDRFGD